MSRWVTVCVDGCQVIAEADDNDKQAKRMYDTLVTLHKTDYKIHRTHEFKDGRKVVCK